jgi:prolyl-tRNA synthetase
MIMVHGDDRGLVLPPRVAPTQVVVLLVRDEDGAGDAARQLVADLGDRGVRVRLDDRTDQSFGRRSTDWELKGVPVRLEVGPRDLADGHVTLVRRDAADKAPLPVAETAERVAGLLETIQGELLARATAFRDERITEVSTIDEVGEACRDGFARVPWAALGDDGERRLAEDGVTVRCLQRPDGAVPDREDEPDLVAFCGRAY